MTKHKPCNVLQNPKTQIYPASRGKIIQLKKLHSQQQQPPPHTQLKKIRCVQQEVSDVP